MKKYYLFLAVFIYFNAEAQNTPTPKYFNKIGKVGKIETTNSEVTITKADTVIVKIYILDRSKIYLEGYQQIRDSAGNYVTAFHFISPDELNSEINIIFNFDKPVIDGGVTCESGAIVIYNSFSSDLKTAQFRGNINCEPGIVAVFRSSEKVSVTIKGIVGVK